MKWQKPGKLVEKATNSSLLCPQENMGDQRVSTRKGSGSSLRATAPAFGCISGNPGPAWIAPGHIPLRKPFPCNLPQINISLFQPSGGFEGGADSFNIFSVQKRGASEAALASTSYL